MYHKFTTPSSLTSQHHMGIAACSLQERRQLSYAHHLIKSKKKQKQAENILFLRMISRMQIWIITTWTCSKRKKKLSAPALSRPNQHEIHHMHTYRGRQRRRSVQAYVRRPCHFCISFFFISYFSLCFYIF
jgi:hypothetical protein